MPQWTSTISYGQFDISAISTMSGDSQVGSKYLAGNLFWLPIKNMWIGVEYLWGQRRDFDGQSATARRIMLGLQYAFP